jgi:hypothetical protein
MSKFDKRYAIFVKYNSLLSIVVGIGRMDKHGEPVGWQQHE